MIGRRTFLQAMGLLGAGLSWIAGKVGRAPRYKPGTIIDFFPTPIFRIRRLKPTERLIEYPDDPKSLRVVPDWKARIRVNRCRCKYRKLLKSEELIESSLDIPSGYGTVSVARHACCNLQDSAWHGARVSLLLPEPSDGYPIIVEIETRPEEV